MTRTVLQRVFPLVLAVLLAGCAVGPTFQADRSGATISNSAASRTTWTDDTGTVTSDFQGTPPALMQVGGGTAAISAPGPHRVLSVSQEPGGAVSLTLADPADTNFKGLSITLADGTEVRLAEFQSSASAVIAAYDRQVIAALETQGRITAEQARVAVAALEAGRTLAEALVEIGVGAVVPTPKKRAVPAVATPAGFDISPFFQFGGYGLVAGAILLSARTLARHNADLRDVDGKRVNDQLAVIKSIADTQHETIRESRQLVRELVEAKAHVKETA